MLSGKPRWMGLGPVSLYGLQEARAKALDARRQRHEGIDPIAARKAARQQARLDAAKAITFKECAEKYIDAHRADGKSAKHATQWAVTLKTYAYPVIGSLPVQAIDTALVTKVIEPICSEKPETASRLRGRIEAILDWAKARGIARGREPGMSARPIWTTFCLPAARFEGSSTMHSPPISGNRRFYLAAAPAGGYCSPGIGICYPDSGPDGER